MGLWSLRGRIALSVQNLVCDGCRGVAVEGESVRILGGVWQSCGLGVQLFG
jgi:hypothetical protein